MKVAILGSGEVGQTLGAGFLKHGHQVMMGTRDPKKEEVANWVAQTPGATAGTFAEAAGFGEVIVLAVLGKVVEQVVQLAGPANLKGKTLIDATNPIADAPIHNRSKRIGCGKAAGVHPGSARGESVQQCWRRTNDQPALRTRRPDHVSVWERRSGQESGV
jgi:predicted dinucleotide-binding enzyme